ncbi:MAG: hypothetical protein V8R85_05160 [Frisingicoccus sp.]
MSRRICGQCFFGNRRLCRQWNELPWTKFGECQQCGHCHGDTGGFPSEDVLAGVEFQRFWERRAYRQGDGRVPVQLYGDFCEGKVSEAFGEVRPVHKGATAFADLNKCLPAYVCDSIKEGDRSLWT